MGGLNWVVTGTRNAGIGGVRRVSGWYVGETRAERSKWRVSRGAELDQMGGYMGRAPRVPRSAIPWAAWHRRLVLPIRFAQQLPESPCPSAEHRVPPLASSPAQHSLCTHSTLTHRGASYHVMLIGVTCLGNETRILPNEIVWVR